MCSFKQKICGTAWFWSQASQFDMFAGSSGSISRTGICVHNEYQPMPERELIARTPTSTSVDSPSLIGYVLVCSKCGTFKRSGRASCCAPGGAWFKNCGGDGNQNVDHSWSEGVKACTHKLKPNGMYCRFMTRQCILVIFLFVSLTNAPPKHRQ